MVIYLHIHEVMLWSLPLALTSNESKYNSSSGTLTLKKCVCVYFESTNGCQFISTPSLSPSQTHQHLHFEMTQDSV